MQDNLQLSVKCYEDLAEPEGEHHVGLDTNPL
jgi:hypothetical protein